MEGLSYLRGELMKIKEVSEQCGLSSKSIRYYEAMGLLDVERSENGYREYDASQIERLKEIRLFRDLFIPIEDIRQYYESEQSMDEFMAQAMNKLQQQIEERKTARDFCAYIQLHYKEKDGLVSYYEKWGQTHGFHSDLEQQYYKSAKNEKRLLLIGAIWTLMIGLFFNIDFMVTMKGFYMVVIGIVLFLSILIYMNVFSIHRGLLKILDFLFMTEEIPHHIENKLKRYFPNLIIRKLILLLIVLFLCACVLGVIIAIMMFLSYLINI
ncbi:MerR family transcriptional regulator [Absiella sp. AM27-20]|nr:MerR family transcriptional regulator [Absiella sp. AM27-20]